MTGRSGGAGASTHRSTLVTGNVYDKYRTRNPLARGLQHGFLTACRDLLALTGAKNCVEVGCGPGDLARSVAPQAGYLGLDIAVGEVARARFDMPERAFVAGSAYALPVGDRAFELVMACEVLEHLNDPAAALAEIERVVRDWVLVSVPWEPVWRMLNLARGSYVGDLGNTPGHVQHFSRRGIVELVQQHFEVVALRRPLPWTMLLAQRRS